MPLQTLLYSLAPFLIVLAPLLLGYLVGRWNEARHLRLLDAREADMARVMAAVSLRHVTTPETVARSELVVGEAVIATDYFKTFAAWLRKLIGGEMRSYESLMRRARREATLRMLERARELGAVEVWNVRYGTSNIVSSNPNNKGAAAEVCAYGTAIIRQSAAGHVQA